MIAAQKGRIIVAFAIIACASLNIFTARSIIPNSDMVQTFNEMLAVRSGNFLLRGWVLVRDNYFLTDLPFMVLGSFIFGKKLWLLYAVPTFVFALLNIVACAIVITSARCKRQALIGAGMVVFLIGLPFVPEIGGLLLISTIHVATIMFVLGAVLLIQPALIGRYFNRLRLIPFGLVVFAAAFSDPLTEEILVLPMTLLIAARVVWYKKFNRDEWLIAASMIFSSLFGGDAANAFVHCGGFAITDNFSMAVVPSIIDIWIDVHAIEASLLFLFTTKIGSIGAAPLAGIVSATRTMALCLIAILGLRRLLLAPQCSEDGVTQFFAFSSLCLISFEAISGQFLSNVSLEADFPGSAIRYVVPIYLLMSIIGALEAPKLFSSMKAGWARNSMAGFGLVAAIAFFGAGIQQVIRASYAPIGYRAAPQAALVGWLEAHDLHYGTGDYWTTPMIIALSTGRVIADPVIVGHGQLVADRWNSDVSRLQAGKAPEFFAFTLVNPWNITVPMVSDKYGTNGTIHDIDGITVVDFKPVS